MSEKSEREREHERKKARCNLHIGRFEFSLIGVESSMSEKS